MLQCIWNWQVVRWATMTLTTTVAALGADQGLALAQAPLDTGLQVSAQDSETDPERRERVAAERFFDLLKRRPRLGTALDKVYGFHVGRGSIDSLCDQLQLDATEASDGKLWLILGMVRLQRGQDALAVDALEKAEVLLPEEPLASYYLGKTLVLIGDVDKSAEAMRRAIDKQPPRADALQIFQDLGRIYQRTGRNQKALEVWSQLENLFPGDAGVQEQIAAILSQEGAEQEALDRYLALADSTKDRFRQIEMSIRAAQLKAKLGNTQEALADFERQLAVVNPDSWLYRDIRRRIEEVFWNGGDFDGLVKYYTEWTAKHPDDVDAMLRTARVLTSQKRSPEAQQWFRKAIQRAPSNTNARQALIEALATDGEYALAAEEMEQLVEIEPENPDYIVRWGELVLSDHDRNPSESRQQAAEIWKRLLATRDDDPVTVSRVADLLRGAEFVEEAIQQYRQAISLAENEPQYREYLGEYLHQLRRPDEALEVWESLASGTLRNRDNLVRLSEVFSTFGYDEQALATIAEACQMKPEFGHRARYAELLREAEKYKEALAQLDLAEELADDRELHELVINERIKNYQARGDLGDRIAELETSVESGDAQQDPAAWRLLALYREANRAFQPACEAIERATELSANDGLYWETAATLYERTGRFGEAVAAYRKLATLDRSFLSNYLTQIATLEMRLGNVDEALQAGEDLLASASGNAEHFRFFASLCMQAGQAQRGLDALRRNVRSNPNDQDALNYLAKTLADEFHTDEAIELYWRSFDVATSMEGKTAIINSLTELYLRTNRFEMLLDRLEIISREENKPRDGTLWLATAHQTAGDLGMARQLLEQLVREESRDTQLLTQLVSLSKTEYDLESAKDYQERLVALSPTPENEYRLATLLMDLGEVDQAEGLWMKLTQRGNRSANLSDSLRGMIDRGQFETAGKLIERALQSAPSDWELHVLAMIVYSRLGESERAVQISDAVLSMSVDPSEPSRQTVQALARSATQRPSFSGYDPYAGLGTPGRTLSSMSQIQTSLQNSATPFGYTSSRSRTFSPSCFADAQAMAKAVRLAALEDSEQTAFISDLTKTALAGSDPAALWEALTYHVAKQPRAARVNYDQYQNDDVTACFQRLVELGDADAAGLSLMRIQSTRIRPQQVVGGSPLPTEELDRLLETHALAATAHDELSQLRSPQISLWRWSTNCVKVAETQTRIASLKW